MQAAETGTEIVRICFSEHIDLDSAKVIEQGRSVVAQGKKIVWEWVFPSFQGGSRKQKELFIRGQQLILESFSKNIYPEFEESSDSFILYRGSGKLSPSDEDEKLYFNEWVKEFPFRDALLESFVQEGYKVHLLAEYLHHLVPMLPEELSINIVIDIEGVDPLFAGFFYSKRIFPHTTIHFTKESDTQSEQQGVILPLFSLLRSEHISLLRSVTPCRYIPEEYALELWQGIESLYVIEDAISARGKRIISGFIAAQGTLKTLPNL